VTEREDALENRLAPPSVLLVSDDAEFGRSVVARWQVERNVPEITLATSDVWQCSNAARYDLLIVEFVSRRQSSILHSLGNTKHKPVICVTEDENGIAGFRSEYPNLLVLPRQEGWTNTLILLASEMLRRVQALGRAHRAERLALESQNHAILGRYMLDMRPNVNNALTSVLGNADLLLLAPRKAMDETRDQIQTIHTMALRLNEIMQRFSSLDAEMRAGEKPSQAETETAAYSPAQKA
jgi:signal transduction histidine kinase